MYITENLKIAKHEAKYHFIKFIHNIITTPQTILS